MAPRPSRLLIVTHELQEDDFYHKTPSPRLCRPDMLRQILRRRRAPRRQDREVATLILLRHGQSVWNGATATFTGWCDVALTSRGRSQAREAGELLRSKGYDKKLSACFTSELERAWETAEICLEAIKADVSIERDWRLN